MKKYKFPGKNQKVSLKILSPFLKKETIVCLNAGLEKEKTQAFSRLGFGGRRWIRTIEAITQQIYSLPPLATREFSHNRFHISALVSAL